VGTSEAQFSQAAKAGDAEKVRTPLKTDQDPVIEGFALGEFEPQLTPEPCPALQHFVHRRRVTGNTEIIRCLRCSSQQKS
jgi:hypothetical protein